MTDSLRNGKKNFTAENKKIIYAAMTLLIPLLKNAEINCPHKNPVT
jgi:hypothetical protein